jgi:hypothetical protein
VSSVLWGRLKRNAAPAGLVVGLLLALLLLRRARR